MEGAEEPSGDVKKVKILCLDMYNMICIDMYGLKAMMLVETQRKGKNTLHCSWFMVQQLGHATIWAGGCLFDCEGHFSVGDGVGLGQDEMIGPKHAFCMCC